MLTRTSLRSGTDTTASASVPEESILGVNPFLRRSVQETRALRAMSPIPQPSPEPTLAVAEHDAPVTATAERNGVVSIVALLPVLSELVTDIGLGSRLIGCSHECDAGGVLNTTVSLTSSKLLASNELDECASVDSCEVAAGWRAVLAELNLMPSPADLLSRRICSYYYTDVRSLASLAPSVLLTHVERKRSPIDPHPDEITEAFRRLSPTTHSVLSLDPYTVSEVYAAAHAIARAAGAPHAATHAVSRARDRLAQVMVTASRSKSRPTRRRPRVAVVQWADPLYLAGAWIPELVQLAGGDPIKCQIGGPSCMVTEEDLRGVDIVIVAVCAVGITGARNITAKLWNEYKHCFGPSRTRMVAVNAVRLFSRASLTTVADTAECLVEIIADHPHYGWYDDRYWEWWTPSL